MKTEAIVTLQEHIDFMKEKLRIEDEQIYKTIFKVTAKKTLQSSFDKSEVCWTALIDKEPVFIFGVIKNSILSKRGIPWLVGTDKINLIKLRILRRSKSFVKEMVERFNYLEGYVAKDNYISYNWLKWCGFNMGKLEPYGPNKIHCYKFWLKKEN